MKKTTFIIDKRGDGHKYLYSLGITPTDKQEWISNNTLIKAKYRGLEYKYNIDGRLYRACMYSPKDNILLVEEYSMTYNPEESYSTDEITCPYCESEISDSWEYGDEDELECSTCGGTFIYTRNVSVSYSAAPVKPVDKSLIVKL